MTARELVYLLASEVDCGKYSPDQVSDECQERQTIGIGAFFVLAVVGLLALWVWWWWMGRRQAARDAAAESQGP